jgi:3-oxoacyl-[acyl-carrier-protein] synthase-3
VATSTPATLSAAAVAIQNRLGINWRGLWPAGGLFQLHLYAGHRRQFPRRLQARAIGAETFSRILDWRTAPPPVLFGDRAGAVVLEAQQQPSQTDRGILTTHLRSDDRHKSTLCRWRPGSTGTVGHLRMAARSSSMQSA